MSSTISCGKRAAVLETSSGNRLYVLFEKTYESNVSPRSPDWSCIHLGYLDSAMRTIFHMAGVCEGGSLRSSSGSFLPENYVRAWLRELANPVSFPDVTFSLRKGKGSWSDTLPAEQLPAIRKWLEEIGRGDVADRIEQDQKVEINISQDTDVALALFGMNRLGAWRLIRDEGAVNGTRDKSLGYTPRAVKDFAIDVPLFVRVTDDDHLERRAGGGWSSCGWAYSIVGHFVNGLWESELKEPGSSTARIRAFRESVKSAVKVPLEGIRVVLDTRVALEEDRNKSYHVAELKKACAMGTDLGDGCFEIPVTRENLSTLTGLQRSMVRWDVDPAALLAAAGKSETGQRPAEEPESNDSRTA